MTSNLAVCGRGDGTSPKILLYLFERDSPFGDAAPVA